MTPIDAHRGPFQLVVIRPMKTKDADRSEWLSGEVEKDDVEAEALALLEDPRDTIDMVHVWSVRDEQFITTYRRRP